jgi:hypothetical protein
MKDQVNLPECQLEQYLDCLKDKDSYHDSLCEKNCPAVCQSISFTIDDTFPFLSERKNGTTKIEIVMSSFNYIVFNETFYWTLDTFLGGFSGALSLWLGISFITVLIWILASYNILKNHKNSQNCWRESESSLQ